MPHRPPTRADIGKTVEFSYDGETWRSSILQSFETSDSGFDYFASDGFGAYEHCRVPYTCPDPIAELTMAADWMADQGHDEAARVLMQFLAMDPTTQAAFLAYRPGDSVTLYHTLLNELVHDRRRN